MASRFLENSLQTSDDDLAFQEGLLALDDKDIEETMSESDLDALPGKIREHYMNRRQQRKRQIRVESAKSGKDAALDELMKDIIKKHNRGEKLEKWEVQLFKKMTEPMKNKPDNPPTIGIPVTEILDDVVKGKYTLQDVHTAREGEEEAEAKDPVENSPLQLLDNVLEESLERTKEALNIKEPGQFFDAYVSSENGVLNPEQIQNALENASTAIQLVLGNPIANNDAKQACNSFIIASSMNEAEIKMKKCQEIAVATKEERERLAQVAAVSGAFSSAAVMPDASQVSISLTSPGGQTSNFNLLNPQASSTLAQPDQSDTNHGFNITDLSYDISFLPSDDPNIYKPLEIVSYIGLTNNIPI